MNNNYVIVKNNFLTKFTSFIKSRLPIDRNRFSVYKKLNCYPGSMVDAQISEEKKNKRLNTTSFEVNISDKTEALPLGQPIEVEGGDVVHLRLECSSSGNASRVKCTIDVRKGLHLVTIYEKSLYAGGLIEDVVEMPYDTTEDCMWVAFICEGGKTPCHAVMEDIRFEVEDDDEYETSIHIDEIPRRIVEELQIGTKLNSDDHLVTWTCWKPNLTQNQIKEQELSNVYVSKYVNDSVFSRVRTDITSFIGIENFTCRPFSAPLITNMSGTFAECNKMGGTPVCGGSVIDMSNTYLNCTNLTGAPYIGGNVQNAYSTYSGCTGLTGTPTIESGNITNLSRCFDGCSNINAFPNLTAFPGNDISYAFNGCVNAEGAIDISTTNVTNADYAFAECHNLTGYPKFMDSVTSMNHTYQNCYNITGNPSFGIAQTTAVNSYSGCNNLTGSVVLPETMTNIAGAFDGCTNLSGNITFLGNETRTLNNWYLAFNDTNVCGSIYFNSGGTAVVNMVGAFANCRHIGGLILGNSSWSTGAASLKGIANRTGHPGEEYSQLNIVVVNATRAQLNTFRTVVSDVTLPAGTNVANINVNIPLCMDNGYVYGNIVCDCWGQSINSAYNIALYVGRPRPPVAMMSAPPSDDDNAIVEGKR